MKVKKLRRKIATLATVTLIVNSLVLSPLFAEDISTSSSAGGVYNCVERDCCECSSVLGSFIQEIIDRNRFGPPQYSVENFKDDLMMGIHKAIKDGTEFDFELAKFEILTLLQR